MTTFTTLAIETLTTVLALPVVAVLLAHRIATSPLRLALDHAKASLVAAARSKDSDAVRQASETYTAVLECCKVCRVI